MNLSVEVHAEILLAKQVVDAHKLALYAFSLISLLCSCSQVHFCMCVCVATSGPCFLQGSLKIKPNTAARPRTPVALFTITQHETHALCVA